MSASITFVKFDPILSVSILLPPPCPFSSGDEDARALTRRVQDVTDVRMVRLRHVGHYVPVGQRHPFGQAGRAARVRHERHVGVAPGRRPQAGRVDGRVDHLAKVPRAVRL